MLCGICWHMLRGQQGRLFKGTFDLRFDHHSSIKALDASSREGCSICRVLQQELHKWTVKNAEILPEELDRTFHSKASLNLVPDIEDQDVFRLDFRLTGGHDSEIISKRTFVLVQNGESVSPWSRSSFHH